MSDRTMSASEPPRGRIGFPPDRLASTSPAKVEDRASYSVTACYANPSEILKSPEGPILETFETEATLPTSSSISASMISSSRESEHGGIPPVAVTSMRYTSNAHLHRVAPQNGFSRLILQIKSRTSLAIRGRPPGVGQLRSDNFSHFWFSGTRGGGCCGSR
jgi:hypothetical protein